MHTKKSVSKKLSPAVKKFAAKKVAAKRASTAIASNSARKLATPKKTAAAAKRIVLDPVVKPKHFSVAAIRDAVRRVTFR